jgi:fucose 4-O-acetylase-like acetyltransferase
MLARPGGAPGAFCSGWDEVWCAVWPRLSFNRSILAYFGFWFSVFGFGGIRDFLRWHPQFRFGLLVSPLCGAAPTFLCSGKEK